jgi:PAS domain-containing protein
MPAGEPKNVVLILARELAANIATPMLVFDRRGTLVFFNEPAERILGQTFAQAGETTAEQWAERWHTEDLDGNAISLLDPPLARVIFQRTPVHGAIRVLGLDGVLHTIEATAYPLFARADEFVGAVGVFWETPA